MLLQLLAFINIHENSGENGGCLQLASLMYLTEENVKHFTCDVCSQHFSSKYNMQRHAAKFHGLEKTVKADIRCPGIVN